MSIAAAWHALNKLMEASDRTAKWEKRADGAREVVGNEESDPPPKRRINNKQRKHASPIASPREK